MAEDDKGLNAKLIRAYIKLREKRSELKSEFEAQDKVFEENMNLLKERMLEYFKQPENEGATNFSSEEGMFIRTTKTKYWTDDWESFHKFVVEENAPELLEKRVAQGNMKQYLEDNPDKLPMGLNTTTEYTITVRKK
jgi:hypothetical protein